MAFWRCRSLRSSPRAGLASSGSPARGGPGGRASRSAGARTSRRAPCRAGARFGAALADDPGVFLATVQVGLPSIGILNGAFSGLTLGDRLDDWLDLYPAGAPSSTTLSLAL